MNETMQRKPFFIFRTLLWLTVLVGLLSGITIGAFFAFTRDLPQIRNLENFEPSAVTRIYSSDQVLLAELFLEKRVPIPIVQIPENLKDALISVEDRQFYTHIGIDLKGILRAIVKDIMAGGFVEGASTITQQLAKTLFLSPQKRLSRKIKEALLAVQLERRYTKEEILVLYLNQIYLGSGTYGVESAAQRYFGVSASQLNLSQCALIAGLPKAPSRYSPLVNPKQAEKRRNLVLRIMLDQGLITSVEYEKAIKEPVNNKKGPSPLGSASYFVQYIKPHLEASIGPSLLYKGGLTIHTTFSYRLQQIAEQAVKKGLAQLQQRRSTQKIKGSFPQGAMVTIDVRSGGILTMVGGKDYSQSAFNRAVDARRQPGSAFKPVVYALAITRGFSQASLVLDAPVVFKSGRDGHNWQPENYSGKYKGEMTLRRALTHSKNIPAVRMVERLGPSAVVEFAHKLGIDSPLDPNLSIALGAESTTLLEMTSAYATFANGGNHTPPFGIKKILDRKGTVIWQHRKIVRPAMSRDQAAIIVDMLQGVIREGTAKAAADMGFPIAGKTGTTNDYKDALFVGFSPNTATGVWVGMDDFTSLGKMETGAGAALPIWTDFMSSARREAAVESFMIPNNMVYRWMDPVSGQVASREQKNAVKALFIKGKEFGGN